MFFIALLLSFFHSYFKLSLVLVIVNSSFSTFFGCLHTYNLVLLCCCFLIVSHRKFGCFPFCVKFSRSMFLCVLCLFCVCIFVEHSETNHGLHIDEVGCQNGQSHQHSCLCGHHRYGCTACAVSTGTMCGTLHFQIQHENYRFLWIADFEKDSRRVGWIRSRRLRDSMTRQRLFDLASLQQKQ